LVLQALRLQVPWVQPLAVLRPARREHRRSARQAAARRVVPAVWSVCSSVRPHSEASSVRRAAAVAPSCFRQAEERRSVAQSGPAWWQAPAAAWCQTAAEAAEWAQPVASAPRARLPAVAAAAVSVARAQPPGVAEAESGPSARRPAAAEVVSAAEAQPPEGAGEAGSGAGVQPPEAAGAVLDVVAEPQQAGVAAARSDAEVQQPVAAEVPAPSVRQPAAARPSALPSWRPVVARPWLARRQVERSAHAKRTSRVASPSRQSWRAAGCEGLS
jgi:hypothetical protein